MSEHRWDGVWIKEKLWSSNKIGYKICGYGEGLGIILARVGLYRGVHYIRLG